MAVTERPLDIENIKLRIERALSIGHPQTFFNNFIRNFPNTEPRRSMRFMLLSPEKRDVKQSTLLHGADTSNFSAKWLDQTPAEFFNTVDQVSAESGYNPHDIEKMVSSLELMPKFYNEVAPKVFIRLLELGYNEVELTM